MKFVKVKIESWYNIYKEENTLIGINPEDLKYIEGEIAYGFDLYIATESIKDNYVEKLLYDFGQLEISWKKEMLGGKN